jgi:hypothetical protein
MSLRSLGSRSWRNGLGVWIGNGLGLGMREFRARLCHLSCFLFVFGSVDFFLVPLPSFVLVLLVLLVFGFAVVRLVSDERAFCISRAWGSFGRHLYIRRLCT